MKFELVQNHFLSDVFGFLLFRNFASMATWRNDYSSVLSQESSLGPDSAFGGKSEKNNRRAKWTEQQSGEEKGCRRPFPLRSPPLADSFFAVSLRFLPFYPTAGAQATV